ncbi:MAG: hypothetical protein GY765_19355 [bacterium]|nr:hypothetical protein [bacterium]
MNILIPVVFGIVGFGLFAASLHFARYKRGKSGCCGTNACSVPGGNTCDRHDDVHGKDVHTQ